MESLPEHKEVKLKLKLIYESIDNSQFFWEYLQDSRNLSVVSGKAND